MTVKYETQTNPGENNKRTQTERSSVAQDGPAQVKGHPGDSGGHGNIQITKDRFRYIRN